MSRRHTGRSFSDVYRQRREPAVRLALRIPIEIIETPSEQTPELTVAVSVAATSRLIRSVYEDPERVNPERSAADVTPSRVSRIRYS